MFNRLGNAASGIRIARTQFKIMNALFRMYGVFTSVPETENPSQSHGHSLGSDRVRRR